MLLQKLDNIFNEYCYLPMDKSISKKQHLFLKHLQQRTSQKLHSSLKRQILKKDSTWCVNHKANKPKRKAKRITRISPLLKKRLLRECMARKAKVVLNKIEDCPDVNAVWIYDRSVGKYKWATYNNIATREDKCEKEKHEFSETIPDELSFVITEVRGNASDVFESVCFISDAETEATVDYSEENTESETDLGGIVEVHESYRPVFQGQNITVQVDERETVEGPLNYEIKPNKIVNSNSEDIGENETSDRENSCTDSLEVSISQRDTTWKERTMNGRSSPFTKKVGGKTKKRRKRCLKKKININKKSSSLYFRRGGVRKTTERRRFTFAKEKRISRIGKHSKRFRDIMKSAPRYWRSIGNLSSKKLIIKKNTEDEMKPTVPLKLRLLETYRKLPETDTNNKDFFRIVAPKSEKVTSLKNLEFHEKTIKLCIRRKKSKASKCSNGDSSSSQANSTDDATTKRKADKQGATTNGTTSDDGYSLLDQELPGYNWLEKKIKSGEIKELRRTSTTSQDTSLIAHETIENTEDPNSCSIKADKEEIATVKPQDSANETIPQDDVIKPLTNDEPEREVSHAKLQEESLFPSETKEPLEVTSPESGVEIDVAPLSAGDSEGDFLAQGIYLVINEGDINSGNNSYVDNATRDLIERKEPTMEVEECTDKMQIAQTEAVCSEIETKSEQVHICNNASCLLSVPDRIKIGNRNNALQSLEVSPSSDSWLKRVITAERKPEEQKCENGLIATYSPISSPASGTSLENNRTQEAVSKATEFEPIDIKNKDISSVINSNTIAQDSNSMACSANQNSAVTSEILREVSTRKGPNDSPNVSLNSAKDHVVSEAREKKTNHIPVQQLSINPLSATPRKAEQLKNALLQGTPNLYGKSENQEIASVSIVNSSKYLPSSQCTKPQSQMDHPANNVNLNYAQEYRANYMKKSYGRYLPPASWPSLYPNPTQTLDEPNVNSINEPICQIAEHYTPNPTLQNEKNFTISSLLELQSTSARSHPNLETNTKTESSKPTDLRPPTAIHKSQTSANPNDSTCIAPPSTLRAHLEGNIQRQKLPEPPKSQFDDDSTDDIKIVYNKLTSYQNKSVSVPVTNHSNMTNKENVNCLPPASQAHSPCLSYQDHHIQSATKERPEQQSSSTAPIPLPIIPKPMPIQGPVRPSPVLVAPMIENVDQQKIYQTPVADNLQPVKRTPPQADNIPCGYQNISSYHAPPKSLREEVEYRKRELMYLDQLARKREKEFEKLQNIRKSKIRLLKLLENRIPTALNKDCSTQKTVPYYYCPQTEKPLVSEDWRNQANAQLVPPENSGSNVMQHPPQVVGTSQVSNVCNSYHHYPPPNDRIRYELNNFISSFNNQMEERRKDNNTVPISRKEHEVPLSREPSQNISAAPPSSVPAFGLPQNSSLPANNVARVVPVTHTKNRVIEVNPTAMLPTTNYVEKGSNCQTSYPVRSFQPPPPFPVSTEANKYQNLPVSQKNYSTCQYQNSSSYDSLYPGASQKMVAPTVRLFDQPIVSSQPSAPNQHQEQKRKEDILSENAQQRYYGNKAWPDQSNWPKHNIQKITPSNVPPYQPEPRMPTSYWPVPNPPVNMYSGSQRLKFQPDVVQQRIEDNAIGLVFVDASKTSHSCNYCNGNAIFLCSSCKKAWYCGRECQRRSWAQHSNVCVGD